MRTLTVVDEGEVLLTLVHVPHQGWALNGRLLAHVIVERDGAVDMVAADTPTELIQRRAPTYGQAMAMKADARVKADLASFEAMRAALSAPPAVSRAPATDAEADDRPPGKLHS
jgi:hypothetical protein